MRVLDANWAWSDAFRLKRLDQNWARWTILAYHAVGWYALFADSSGSLQGGLGAFVIDCLKHPEEVKALRLVYGPGFFLVSSICDREIRLANLRKKYRGASDRELDDLMETDAAEKEDFGQQVRKTIPLADYFVNQNHHGGRPTEPTLDAQIQRLLALVLGTEVQRPNHDERGMYAAWGAAMRSACLSRQVGAAILNPQGIVIATGTNDVPAPGGGIYGNETAKDARCFLSLDKEPGRELAERQRNKIQLRVLGKDEGMPINEQHPFCRSDFAKDAIYQSVSDKLSEKLTDALSGLATKSKAVKEALSQIDASNLFSKDAVEEIFKSTPVRDLVEFSRAIHAEADAIVSLARAGGPSCQNASLYVNVFPCHLCTRQIIAAGIAEVIYIEPYPKSMATILHDDAIFDPEAKSSPATEEKRVRTGAGNCLDNGRKLRVWVWTTEENPPDCLDNGRKRPPDNSGSSHLLSIRYGFFPQLQISVPS